MARRSYAGAAAALTLSSGINATDLTITTTGTATGWPSGSGGKFLVVIARGTAGEEKVYATSRSGNVFTVASTGDRGVDGTGAATHATGVAIEHCIGATDVDEANAHVADTTRDDHTQYLKTDGTRALTGVATIAAIAGASAVGDTAAKGSGPTVALSDHRHSREAFATPVATGTANAAGSATTVPHSDHVHLAYNHVAGYVAQATPQALTGSQADVTGLSVTFTAVLGRRYKVEAWVWADMATTSDAFGFLMEGASQLSANDARNSSGSTSFACYFVIPYVSAAISSGSHTFKVQASKSGGTVNVNSTNQPSFILITDLGT